MQPTQLKHASNSHLKLCLLQIMFIGMVFFLLLANVSGADINPEFNHDETNFPLDFVHARVSCESCHVQGIFQGTPTRCRGCHSRTGIIQASAPSPNHIRTTGDCEFCHQSSNWDTVIKVDHFAVIGSCQSCHNGAIATGKNPGHIQSSENCDDCHRTFTWLDAVFDHSNITDSCINCHNGVTADAKIPTHILSTDNCEDCHRTVSWVPVIRVDHDAVIGACFNCHNGVTAEGKHPQHLITSNDCELCHSTLNWSSATFNHDQITSSCFNCHNGVTAEGKNQEHIAAGNECEFCHVTQGWLPATFDHSLAVGSCSGCHDGIIATGKTVNHFITSLDCNECHSTVNWLTLQFSHRSMTYPGDHRQNLACTSCHAGNNESASWRSPSFIPDCAACHETNYVPGPHLLHANPDTFYSVSDLRDCTGACHVYTDSSQSVILENRTGQHRVFDPQF